MEQINHIQDKHLCKNQYALPDISKMCLEVYRMETIIKSTKIIYRKLEFVFVAHPNGLHFSTKTGVIGFITEKLQCMWPQYLTLFYLLK